MRSTSLLALASSVSSALAVYQGFNYGSTQTDGSSKDQATFEAEFTAAKGLTGTNEAFTSARLYTMIQAGTTNDVIEAIPAAIATETSLLLTLWASGGATYFANELAAFKSAISEYGTDLAPLVAGISIGSEDLYRETPTGIAADAGVGADPDTLVSYIAQVREAIEGTALSGASIGHVDTWNAWVNTSVTAVIDAVDWLGVDEYPFYQDTESNGIDNALTLFDTAYDAVVAIAGGKDVWITETGWPVSGSTEGDAVPGLAAARTYWVEIGCPNFGAVNTWWYTLQDAYPVTPDPSFGVVGYTLDTTPLYDLSCSNVSTSSTSSVASSATASIASSAASAASAQATTGGALTPSQSAGNGVGTAAASGVAATATGSGASGAASASGAAATGASSSNGTVVSTGSPSSTASAVATGAAAAFSVPLVGGALGAVVALMAAL